MANDIRIEGSPMAQGAAKPATTADLVKDAAGITYPNLHRRIDTDLARLREPFVLTTPDGVILTDGYGQALTASAEYGPGGMADISLSVQGVNSFRTVSPKVHEENSTTSEVP